MCLHCLTVNTHASAFTKIARSVEIQLILSATGIGQIFVLLLHPSILAHVVSELCKAVVKFLTTLLVLGLSKSIMSLTVPAFGFFPTLMSFIEQRDRCLIWASARFSTEIRKVLNADFTFRYTFSYFFVRFVSLGSTTFSHVGFYQTIRLNECSLGLFGCKAVLLRCLTFDWDSVHRTFPVINHR